MTEHAASTTGHPGRASESLSVEEIHGLAALAGCGSEWRALAERACSGSFFSTWEWTNGWLESFRRGSEPLIVIVRRGERMVGVLPLVREARGVLGRSNTLCVPVNSHSPRAPFLFEGDPVPVVDAILGHLGAALSPLRLHLPRLPVTCPGTEAFESQQNGPFFRRSQVSRRSATVRLDGDWPSYLALRSVRVRREWRRKRRRLERSGPFEFVTVTAPSAVPGAMAEVLDIERRSWKHGNGTSIAAEPGCEGFYGDLARRCAERGWLRLHLLRMDGRPVAHVLAVAYGSEYLPLKTSYDERLAGVSPGLMIMLEALKSAFAEGRRAFDLLGGEARWKEEMATDVKTHVDVCLFSPQLVDCQACSLVNSHVKPVVRQRMPWLARARRVLLDGWRSRRRRRPTRGEGGRRPSFR